MHLANCIFSFVCHSLQLSYRQSPSMLCLKHFTEFEKGIAPRLSDCSVDAHKTNEEFWKAVNDLMVFESMLI